MDRMLTGPQIFFLWEPSFGRQQSFIEIMTGCVVPVEADGPK